MSSVERLPVDELAARCQEDTQRFRHEQVSETEHCFELLRRALGDGHTEAFTRVYHIYEPQVRQWVYSHSRFSQTGESADYFVSSALTSFYFALRGDKFANFDLLPKVLSYLKLCVHTAIMQHLRKTPPASVTELSDETSGGYSAHFDAGLNASAVWERICELLRDDDDRHLAHCVFVQSLKPAQIVDEFPERYETARQVSVALQRIRRTLRRDDDLRRLAGFDDSDLPA